MNAARTLSAALFLFGAAGAASAQPGGVPGGPGMHERLHQGQPDREVRRERGEGAQRRGFDRAALVERFDTDGDGELSEAERAGARETIRAQREAKRAEIEARLLARFDDNGDGELDEAERPAVRETLGPMIKERGRRGHEANRRMHKQALERFDADGDGRLGDAEKANARAFFEQKKTEVVARFDADGDGELNEAERKAARAHHRERRMLDANRDGVVDAIDAQIIMQRAAGGERIPDINRDGARDASDAAELLRRIGSYED